MSFMLTMNRSNFDGKPQELYIKPAPYGTNMSLIGAEIRICASDELNIHSFRQFAEVDGSPRHHAYSTRHGDCFDFLQMHLRDCQQNHTYCRTKNPYQWKPTRLLDVGHPELGKENVLVVETASWSAEERLTASGYITLSHMWGKERFFTLLTSNLEDVTTSGIDITLLRRSFQDAIHATRKLGYRYIWIDSLCIIQDSVLDWEIEAGMMDKVYSMCDCSIAASTISSIKDSLFNSSDSRAMMPIRVPLTWSNGEQDIMFFALDWHCDANQISPLSRRGWVMQEGILSPRTMHFSAFPIWECRTSKACVAYTQCSNAPNRKLRDDIAFPWTTFVSTYSQCELSFFEDKLVAISGVARKVAEQKAGTKYLAGLWDDEHLLGSLYWNARTFAARRYERYIGPSWTWASVHGQTGQSIFMQVDVALARVLFSSIVPAGDDEYGQVKDGYLAVRCRLFPMSLLNLESFTCNIKSTDLFYVCRWGPWYILPDDYGVRTLQGNTEDSALSFMPLYESHLSPDNSGYWQQICGLLLQEVPGRSTLYDGAATSRTYRRVGCARVSKTEYAAEMGEHFHDKELLSGPWDEGHCQTVILV
ncbi:HET-domain-containing protein [Lophiostoma macrostomum CBS 122681]|uniref:HET-domain-containing protein n=1 Tax=Lophiostoma macrostomum CBS 122681 TaxID=1314788 RepID=A0A6A6TT91_9PLEO|nr:HET-domain-containing protein [Lophiostoma macrostomum CBS 122681]